MEVRFKKFSPDATTPEFKTDGSLGADLAATEEVIVKPGKATMVPLGVGIDTPKNHTTIIALRSSMPVKKGLFIPNGIGIIDSDYKGEYKLLVATLGNEEVVIEKGERVAQVIQIPCKGFYDFAQPLSYKEVDDIGDSGRGEGGFGSTGRF